MKTKLNFNYRFYEAILAVLILIGSMLFLTNKSLAQEAPIKNVVIVHGAFADGSGWRGVYDILSKKGFHVTVVQNPLTGIATKHKLHRLRDLYRLIRNICA